MSLLGADEPYFAHHHRSAVQIETPRFRSWQLALLPGIVAALAVTPVMSLGPLALAIRSDFSLFSSVIGFISAGFFVTSALAARPGAWVATTFDPLMVLRVGLLVITVSAVGLTFTGSLTALVIQCVFAGVVNGLLARAGNILISTRVRGERRGMAFGIKVAAVPASASVAALGALAVASGGLNWQHTYWFCVAVALLSLAATIRIPVRANAARLRTRQKAHGPVSRSLALLGLGGLLGASATTVLSPFLADSLIANGVAPASAAATVAVSGWVGIAGRVLLGGLSDRVGGPLLHLHAASAMLAVAFLGISGLALGGTTGILVAASVASLGIGWSWPGLLHHAVLETHRADPARATGFMQTGTFAGAVIGPLCFGLVAEHASFAWAWGVAAVGALLAAILLWAGTRAIVPSD